MSSPFPVLNNRPIDQWRVTELKEELRRRKLKINGLKEELVRRLDEALRIEMEEAERENLGNGLDPEDGPLDTVDEEVSVPPAPTENSAQPVEDNAEEQSAPLPAQDNTEPTAQDNAEPTAQDNAEPTAQDNTEPTAQDNAEPIAQDNAEPIAQDNAEPVEDKNKEVDADAAMIDNTGANVDFHPDIKDEGQIEVGVSLEMTIEDTKEDAIPLANSPADVQTMVSHSDSNHQDTRDDEKDEDVKPSAAAEDAMFTISEPANQVSEVSQDLGFQVKSDSISTDSVSINEKNELKDNLNATNVHLELEVKPEMVQPSSSDVATIGGDSHPLEDDKELADNQASLEEAGDVKYATDMEVCKKIEVVEMESPEKLNLDRSSGDESMEEDIVDTKQIESKNNIEDERKGGIKEDSSQITTDASVGALSSKTEDMVSDQENKLTAAPEKRKAEDEEVANKINEPKRQRRWNSETTKISEPASTTRVAFQPALRRSFGRSDSSVSEDAPKERVVPPSQKPATTSLRIDHFLRPFTLKAVQELLAKTGSVTEFWMDQIKTHCYVTYSSIEEATATRNALYNLQWPTNGGRLLVAEFVDPQEVKMKLGGPPQSPAPVTPSPTTPTAPPLHRQPLAPPPARPNLLRQQQLPPPPPLPTPPTLANPPQARERLPPPPPLKKPEPPLMTLDDLFKKTKATPRIYYMPLSEEQVATKLQAQGKGAKN